MSFIVCAYYTENTPYKDEARAMMSSARQLDLNCLISSTRNFGTWQKNTHYKSVFIRYLMHRYSDRNIVYVDADAIFHSYPLLFDEIDCDIAAYFRDWRFAKNELLSGTLFIENNEKMLAIVDEWIAENKKNPNTWEQRNLQAVINRHPELNIYRLPVEYCCIFDSQERRNGCKPVIEHFQRSRRYRRLVNAG